MVWEKIVRNFIARLTVICITSIAVNAFAAAAPKSIGELALYQGADREKLLIDGAKREGQFTLYTSHTWFRTFVKEFEKKYPFVKASEWRNDSKNVIRKVFEEAKAGRVLADAVETTADGMGVMKREGLFQEFYSPEARFYPNELKPRGKSGFFYLPNRETYNSLAFNTKLIAAAGAPRSLKDLADPRWKGKMAITSTTTGARWIGNILETLGRDFLDKLGDQDVSVQDMAPAALVNLVVSGEVPLSPTIFDANVTLAKQKGAAVEWRPLEPVVATVGSVALIAKAANPNSAMLFIDYLLSKEGQQLIMKGGLWSPREDLGTLEQKFKKNYLDEKYSSEEIEVKIGQWENLLRQIFIRKR
jgi:iron(III) transport system substrate-binding protein